MEFGFFDFDGGSGSGGGDVDKLMSDFNSKYTLCLLGRNVMVAVHDVSISTGVTFMQVAQWSTFNCHITVEITGDNGKPKTTPFTSVWLKSPKANRCTKVEFLPAWGAPPVSASGALNTFRGFAIQPNPLASCQLLLAHHNEVLCAGDPETIRYSLQWWSSLVRNPERKIGTTIIYRGGQGAWLRMAHACSPCLTTSCFDQGLARGFTCRP